jgi:hypothetical protein
MSRVRNEVDWKTIIRRIKGKQVTPIISSRICRPFVADQEVAVRTWAEEIDYPLADRVNVTRVAQFASTTGHDALAPKEEYLEFLKQRLLDRAAEEPSADQSGFLRTLQRELPDLSFSQVAERLDYPSYENELDNPLRKLAELPLPIYLTTSFTTFMEDALRAAGKQPRTEVCPWQAGPDSDSLSVFEEDAHYQPSPEEPLVFHVHGIDSDAGSLVLSEDDYLDYLVRVSQDPDAIPKRVNVALTDSSLLLLGYQLRDWDFRTLFRGLIISRRSSRKMLSLAIQLRPDRESAEDLGGLQDYLERYFQGAYFEIYWGDAESFIQELWEQWES